MQQYYEECYYSFDNIDDDNDVVIEIPHDMFDMFDFDPTTETTPTATTAGQYPHENRNQKDSPEMTLEAEIQQREE